MLRPSSLASPEPFTALPGAATAVALDLDRDLRRGAVVRVRAGDATTRRRVR